MNIESEKFKVEMTHSEMWDTAFDIKNALKYTLESHWVNHQKIWKETEKERLYRLRIFFSHLGRKELYEEIYDIADKIFEKFNKEKKNK